MATDDREFSSLSMNSPSNTNQSAPPVDNNRRAEKYKENRNENKSSFLGSKWFTIFMIVISIGLLIVCIVLAIVIATKFKKTEESTPSPSTASPSTPSSTKPTPQTTTPTDPESQPFILQCNPDKSTDTKKRAETHQRKNQHTSVKIPLAPERLGNLILLKNTYMVEFPADVGVQDYFRTITASLRASNQIHESEIKIRSVIYSSLFNGASFSVTTKDSIELSKVMEGAIDIHPVYLVPAPRTFKSSFSSDKSIDSDSYLINAFDLTGVDQVHKKFQNFGTGVRVAVIDSGIDYSHPALGGCFGPRCRVAFGYDLAGDEFSRLNPTAEPDNDPMDNCSASAHGTHVAGIIAANITGINDGTFAPSVPFSGVAPNVTLGAYRVFGCLSDYTSTDMITEAIYRAYDDAADIITISIGGAAAYSGTSHAIAIDRVSDMGVYVTVSMGNNGDGGLQTGSSPGLAEGAMAIGSADNSYTLQYVIIAPGGYKILYDAGSLFGQWKSIFNSTIIVNDPNGMPNDGCSALNKIVRGAVVLFRFNGTDSCSSLTRCERAASAGAVACLVYNVNTISGSIDIPSGRISLKDGLRIVTTVTANPSAVYTFTNLLDLTPVETVGTPSSFSSFGLTGDLLPKPQIMGIGGKVYSTTSVASAQDNNRLKPYVILSGTSMAAPYVAGVLALFLSSIGNPAPLTVNGHAANGKCRPKFSLTMNIFQSSAKIVKIHNSSLFATTAKQGAGLVNAFQALTATTIFTPSELGLNDTVRKATSYKVNVINIGSKRAVYKLSHQGAALATGATANDDQLMPKPLFSPNYADVTITPSEFALQPGQSREIILRFSEPPAADPTLLPIYSGFIYATNLVNGEVAHMLYTGVVGDYGDARIFVRNTSSGVKTGIQNENGTYISDGEMPVLNATGELTIQIVLAWSTRRVLVEVVPAEGNVLIGFNVSSGVVYFDESGYTMPLLDLPRNVPPVVTTRYLQSYLAVWHGQVVLRVPNGSSTDEQINSLHPGRYRLKFSALKHFGNPSNPNAFEVYHSPSFNLQF